MQPVQPDAVGVLAYTLHPSPYGPHHVPEPHFLLLQSAVDGAWAPPYGILQPGDDGDVARAGLRVLFESTGLTLPGGKSSGSGAGWNPNDGWDRRERAERCFTRRFDVSNPLPGVLSGAACPQTGPAGARVLYLLPAASCGAPGQLQQPPQRRSRGGSPPGGVSQAGVSPDAVPSGDSAGRGPYLRLSTGHCAAAWLPAAVAAVERSQLCQTQEVIAAAAAHVYQDLHRHLRHAGHQDPYLPGRTSAGDYGGGGGEAEEGDSDSREETARERAVMSALSRLLEGASAH